MLRSPRLVASTLFPVIGALLPCASHASDRRRQLRPRDCLGLASSALRRFAAHALRGPRTFDPRTLTLQGNAPWAFVATGPNSHGQSCRGKSRELRRSAYPSIRTRTHTECQSSRLPAWQVQPPGCGGKSGVSARCRKAAERLHPSCLEVAFAHHATCRQRLGVTKMSDRGTARNVVRVGVSSGASPPACSLRHAKPHPLPSRSSRCDWTL